MTKSFAQLFEESLKNITTRPGSIVRGTIVSIAKDIVLVDAGLKSESAIPIAQFYNAQGELEIKVNDQVDVALDAVEDGFGETILSRDKAKRHEAWLMLEQAYEEAAIVTGIINSKVKGGFTVELNGIRAFLPGSLVDMRPVRDTLHLEGKELEFKVIKLDQKRNNVVVSRRAVIESENSFERDNLLENMQEGMEVKGGVDGLLHITDRAWKRVKHPSEIVTIGDEIIVKILKFDRERTRVSLGLKQLSQDPWYAIAQRYPENSRLTGRVTNLTDYGCFVEIEEGVEGLVHVSEMDWTNKNVHPSKVVNVNDIVEIMVLDIDEERRRISLGLKQCQANPWQKFAETHEKGDRVEEMMPRLWTQLFRVMDDVHEGTRQAATSTVRIFSKLCVQWCDPDKGKAGEAMVKTILPTILETGICHQVAEIRSISVDTVSQLVKSGGPLLRPHLPLLIPALLEAAGELEPLSLNYLSVRMAGDQRTQDIVDSVRASAAKSHYTTETVSKCVQYIDENTFAVMLPKLQDLLRSSVGLGTRVATAHFVVLLSHHLTIEQFQPHVGKLLSVLFSGLTDRNSTIRRTCANAIGQLVRSAKSSSVDKLLEKLKTNYLEKEDESIRTAVGLTLQAMARHNQDVVKSRSDLVIPLVFFAMHTAKNKDDPVSVSNWELWQDVWHEVSPGTEAALTRHLDQVMALQSSVMESPSWHVKAQAARSIETLASKLGGSLEADRRDVLVTLLVSGLAGRTWDGKEQLLAALGSLCKHSKSLKGSPSAETIVDAILRECGKEKVSYKSSALAALGEVLEALEVDRFRQVYNIVQEILTKEVDNEEDEKQEETSKRREELLNLREIAFSTLGKAWPRNEVTQVEFREQVVAQCGVSCLENNTRSVQVKIMMAVFNYFEKLSFWDKTELPDSDRVALRNIIDKFVPAMKYALGISKHTQLRKEALNVLLLLARNCKKLNETVELTVLETIFKQHLEELNKDNSPEIKSRVVDMKDFFNDMSKD
ncbi:hypothetical protein J6590_023052 [Homalodisca vitripennis]|nr:hypothetical protein J6590_023052 [Homalodisca vitripennis]